MLSLFKVQCNFELHLEWISKLLSTLYECHKLLYIKSYCYWYLHVFLGTWRWYHASVKYFFILTPSIAGKIVQIFVYCRTYILKVFRAEKGCKSWWKFHFQPYCTYYLASGHKFLEQCFEWGRKDKASEQHCRTSQRCQRVSSETSCKLIFVHIFINNYLSTKSKVFTEKSQTKTLPYWPSNSKTTKEHFKLLVLQVVAVVHKGFQSKGFDWETFGILWKAGRWGEVVAIGVSTVLFYGLWTRYTVCGHRTVYRILYMI